MLSEEEGGAKWRRYFFAIKYEIAALKYVAGNLQLYRLIVIVAAK